LNSLSDPNLKTSLHTLLIKLKGTWPGRFLPGKSKTVTSLSPRDFFVGLIVLSASISAVVGIFQVTMTGLSIHNRTSGALSNYMTFSGLLMQVSLVTVAYLFFCNGKNKWMWSALLLMVTALALTLTRQAWLGFGIGLLFLLAFRKPVWMALLPVFATLMFWISPTPIKERIQSIANLEDVTFQERLSMWRLGWKCTRSIQSRDADYTAC